jgi:hypothetical protein
VIIEKLVEKNPELALSLCPILFNVFPQKNLTIQRDILYVLGEAGEFKNKRTDHDNADRH